MNERSLRRANEAELPAIAPSARDDGEVVQVAVLNTRRDGRRLVALGVAAVGALATAILAITPLIQGPRPQFAAADRLANTATETGSALPLPPDSLPRFPTGGEGARYDFEGIDPPAAPFRAPTSAENGTLSCGPIAGVGEAKAVGQYAIELFVRPPAAKAAAGLADPQLAGGSDGGGVQGSGTAGATA